MLSKQACVFRNRGGWSSSGRALSLPAELTESASPTVPLYQVRPTGRASASRVSMTVLRAVVAPDPSLGAIAEVFLFPNGNTGLHLVDDVTAGIERRIPMSRGNTDHDGESPDLDLTRSMNAAGMMDREAFHRLGHDSISLFFGKRRIGFVFESVHRASFVVISNPAFKRAKAARGGIEDRFPKEHGIEGCVLDGEGHDVVWRG